MKLVSFASDGLELEQTRRQFLAAGIACKIVQPIFPQGRFPSLSYSELWIDNDFEYQRALLLSVVFGSLRRALQVPLSDECCLFLELRHPGNKL